MTPDVEWLLELLLLLFELGLGGLLVGALAGLPPLLFTLLDVVVVCLTGLFSLAWWDEFIEPLFVLITLMGPFLNELSICLEVVPEAPLVVLLPPELL